MPHAECSTILHREGRLSALDATGTLGRAGLEAVGELAADGLEVLHAAGTSGLSPLGLLTPVVCGSMLVVFLMAERCVVGVGSSIGGLEEGGVRRTLPDGSARVTAVGASVLLHVQRATTLKVY
jgi:hypothetical protein